MMDKNETDPIEVLAISSYSEEIFYAVNELLKQLTAIDLNFTESIFKQILAAENSTLVIARDRQQSGKIIGTLSFATFRVPTGLNFRIEDVVVDQSARGKGVGRKLMIFAIENAQKLNVDRIDLTSSNNRVAANQLYQSLGFKLKETNVYRLEKF